MVAIQFVGDAVFSGGEGTKIPMEAWQVVRRLAADWGDVADWRALKVEQLSGAMTNLVYQVEWPSSGEEGKELGEGGGGRPRMVLVRVYGEGASLFFEREDEVRTFEFISRHGHGPRLLGRFANGRVEEFIHAKTLSAMDLRDPEISALIAAKLRQLHELEIPGPRNTFLWDRLRNWLQTAKSLCSAEEEEKEEFQLDVLEMEISTLENELSCEDHRIGFCHNDLQYGNIMIDEDTKAVTIIDYEYASYNPIAYDIANHFCEMTANYHTETPHLLDNSKYPDIEKQKRFVETYLGSSGRSPGNDEVESLLQSIEKYTLASHLQWGLWGIISRHLNKIEFDYLEYARQRFQQYWLKKSATVLS